MLRWKADQGIDNGCDRAFALLPIARTSPEQANLILGQAFANMQRQDRPGLVTLQQGRMRDYAQQIAVGHDVRQRHIVGTLDKDARRRQLAHPMRLFDDIACSPRTPGNGPARMSDFHERRRRTQRFSWRA